MQNSRLIQLLKILKPTEIKELTEFVQCKIFHSNKNKYDEVVLLFKEIISPKNKILTPSKEELALKLSKLSNKKSDKNHLNRCISKAIDLVQKYLIYTYHIGDSKKSEHTLLKILKERDNNKLFEFQQSKIKRTLKAEKVGSEYFYQHYELYKESISEVDTRSINLKSYAKEFKNAITNFDLYFLINQFNYFCLEKDIGTVLNLEKFNFPLLEHLLNEIPNTSYFEEPIIKMYWNAYQMLTKKTENFYLELKKNLFKEYVSLKSYYTVSLFIHLENYCITKINAGDSRYFSDFWEISIFQLEKELVKELIIGTYKNLVTTGVMLALQQEKADFSNVLQFIKKHSNKLPPKYRLEAETYGESYISFYQDNFETVAEKLIIHQEPLTIYKFEDIFFQVDSRRLLVMTYFCLQEDNNFDKMCNNLSVFLNERKEFILELELTKNRQFLIFIKKLFWLPINKKEKQNQLQQIKQEIEACQQVSDKKWLLKQINLILSQI